MMPGDFASFADRIQRGGTLDDDFPDLEPGGGALQRPRERREPWYRRFGNWLMEALIYD